MRRETIEICGDPIPTAWLILARTVDAAMNAGHKSVFYRDTNPLPRCPRDTVLPLNPVDRFGRPHVAAVASKPAKQGQQSIDLILAGKSRRQLGKKIDGKKIDGKKMKS